MIFKIILIFIVVAAILWGIFHFLHPQNYLVKQGCFNDATMLKRAAKQADDLVISRGVPLVQRQDYDKIFNDAYQSCLQKHGIAK